MCARCRGEGGEGPVEDEATRCYRSCPQEAAEACVFSGLSFSGSENPGVDECLQGYHDIISVLMLTMAPSENDDLERLESAAEKLSLHRLRDAMGQGLEPLLGMLRWDPILCLFSPWLMCNSD
jgi:hypothetical protein